MPHYSFQTTNTVFVCFAQVTSQRTNCDSCSISLHVQCGGALPQCCDREMKSLRPAWAHHCRWQQVVSRQVWFSKPTADSPRVRTPSVVNVLHQPVYHDLVSINGVFPPLENSSSRLSNAVTIHFLRESSRHRTVTTVWSTRVLGVRVTQVCDTCFANVCKTKAVWSRRL